MINLLKLNAGKYYNYPLWRIKKCYESGLRSESNMSQHRTYPISDWFTCKILRPNRQNSMVDQFTLDMNW